LFNARTNHSFIMLRTMPTMRTSSGYHSHRSGEQVIKKQEKLFSNVITY